MACSRAKFPFTFHTVYISGCGPRVGNPRSGQELEMVSMTPRLYAQYVGPQAPSNSKWEAMVKVEWAAVCVQISATREGSSHVLLSTCLHSTATATFPDHFQFVMHPSCQLTVQSELLMAWLQDMDWLDSLTVMWWNWTYFVSEKKNALGRSIKLARCYLEVLHFVAVSLSSNQRWWVIRVAAEKCQRRKVTSIFNKQPLTFSSDTCC